MIDQEELIAELGRCSGDPLRFVLFFFPWGEPDGELADAEGPEPWQVEVLTMIRDGLLTVNEAIRIAVASGHGVGKSAMVAWIILWAIATLEDTRGVVTANTENQLKTKTWAELAKWFRLFLAKDMFKMTATAIFAADPEHEKTWRIDMVPWSEHNTEAFAGLHNLRKRILVVFDEGSAIPDVIWETTEGALTDKDTQILWLVCGNPTRNTGRFRECWSKFKHRWKQMQVDARKVSVNTNKRQHAEWVEDYGEDSDFVRIRVRGEFPRAGSLQFISSDLVAEASRREALPFLHDALVLGVDVARFGDDASVIYIRKGRDGRTHPPIILRGVDTMTLAGKVSELYGALHANAVFVDGGGVGGGVVDRLRQLSVPVWDIQFGAKSDRPIGDESIRFANKRCEMWGHMKEWLKGGAIGDVRAGDHSLADEISSLEYAYNSRDEIQLEKKVDLKKRMGFSPDLADALALTFAYPVQASHDAGHLGPWIEPKALIQHEYNPYEAERLSA